MKDHKNLSNTRGFSLLELLLAVAMMAMVIVGIAGIVSRQGDEAKANVVALQLKTIGEAAGEYIKDAQSTLLQNTQAANSKVIITLPMLQAAGYLNTGFNVTNGYQQNTCVVVRRAPNPTNNPQLGNDLLGLVVTQGGNAVDDLTLGQISATIGSGGGAVYAQNAAQVTGALGGWNFDKTLFEGATVAGLNTLPGGAQALPGGQNCSGAGNIALSVGHPTVSLWFSNGASRSASGMLYRNAVAGQPELNTMNTALLTAGPAIIPDTQIGKPCNAGSAPNILGAIATAQDGSVVSCVNNVWTKVENKFWGAPADTIAALGTCDASKAGGTRMVKSVGPGTISYPYGQASTNPSLHHPYVPYTCDGTGTWKPIAIDQNGNLEVESLTSNVGTNLYGPTTIGKPSIGSPYFEKLSVFSHTNFYNGLNVRNKNVNLNADADLGAYDSEGTASINVYGKGDINLYTGSGKLRLSQYMSFQNQVSPSTIGTSCSDIDNGKAVTMTTEGKLISCQNGIWALATTPDIGTKIYLYGTAYGGGPEMIENCPVGWTQAGYTTTNAYYAIRICVNTLLSCQVINLTGYSYAYNYHYGEPLIGDCPHEFGWTEAGFGRTPSDSYARTCIKC